MNQTNEEIFPTVDESDIITGQAARSFCHNRSMLLHPVVHLHVFNPAGELYLQKRSANNFVVPVFRAVNGCSGQFGIHARIKRHNAFKRQHRVFVKDKHPHGGNDIQRHS